VAFEIDNPGVVPKAAKKLANSHVDGVDALGVTVEQSCGEPSCARSEINHDAARDRNVHLVEGVGKLDIAAQPTRRQHAQGSIGGNAGSRAGDEATVDEDAGLVNDTGVHVGSALSK
jgi:hypothetical protein